MFKNILSKVNTKYGKIIISIILGIGLEVYLENLVIRVIVLYFMHLLLKVNQMFINTIKMF